MVRAPCSKATRAADRAGVYGALPAELLSPPAGAIQFSPLIPGAAELEAQAEAPLGCDDDAGAAGNAGAALRARARAARVAPGGAVLRPRAEGSGRLAPAQGAGSLRLHGRGNRAAASSHRDMRAPASVTGIEDALRDGARRIVADLGLWSQPGVFSWDRVDRRHGAPAGAPARAVPGAARTSAAASAFCRARLWRRRRSRITLIDIDRRAVACAQHNVGDPRAAFVWGDVRRSAPALTGLDFVVMNAPFHDAGSEDKALPQAFVKRAAEVLRNGGVCWLTANRHLPYEAVMKPLFRHIELKADAGGYKVYEMRK